METANHPIHSLLDENRSSAAVAMETGLAGDGPEQPEAISFRPSSKSFSYFSSRDFIELLGCLGFLLVISLLSLIGRELNERPIPAQVLKLWRLRTQSHQQ
jgi:hypothetical protein